MTPEERKQEDESLREPGAGRLFAAAGPGAMYAPKSNQAKLPGESPLR